MIVSPLPYNTLSKRPGRAASVLARLHPSGQGPFLMDDPTPLLSGVRVLDASRVLAGPFCGQLLGDLGAEVIKVERPGTGDDTREWGPPALGPLSAYFMSCNRNKKAITLDLARPEGVALLHELARKSDILLE